MTQNDAHHSRPQASERQRADPAMLPPSRQPAILLPGSIVLLLALIIGIQALRGYLSTENDTLLIYSFALLPLRYSDPLMTLVPWVDSQLLLQAVDLVSHGFLHADWMHVLINGLWLAAFGTPVARRLGGVRMVLLFVGSIIAGGALFLALHWGEVLILLGASGGVSGVMGASVRFIFLPGGPLMVGGRADAAALRRPRRPLIETLRERRAIVFVGVWFLVNFLAGANVLPLAGETGAIAWDAHLGGFLFGLLLFPLFDSVPANDPPDETPAP